MEAKIDINNAADGRTMKKYELTEEVKTLDNGTVLHRIRALRRIKPVGGFSVKRGELGGWVECESNLSQCGEAWIFGSAQVYGSALVDGSAIVFCSAVVYGSARVTGSAQVCGSVLVDGMKC